MDFELFSIIAGIASILGVVFYLWDKYKKKREGESNQDVSESQNANITVNIGTNVNIGSNTSSEIIESVLHGAQNTTNTQEQISIPLQIDETVSNRKQRNQQDETSEFLESDFTIGSALEQIRQLSEYESKDTAEQLKNMRKKWQDGHKSDKSKVIQWLEGLRNSKWPFLSSEVKADVLLFEAGIELEKNRDISRARELADEARTLMPSQNQIRIRAWIVCHEKGPKEALSVLDNQKDIDSLNLRANFLLMLNRVEEALEVLDFEDESNGEN